MLYQYGSIMIKKIYKISNETHRDTLYATSTDIDVTSEEYTQLVQDLRDTITVGNMVGLSAPQIGVLSNVFIMVWGNSFKVITNPNILSLSGKTYRYREGCESCPASYFETTHRSKSIKLEYYDCDTQDIETIKLKTRDAVIAQHELDHLCGVLIWSVDEPYPAEDENAQVIV